MNRIIAGVVSAALVAVVPTGVAVAAGKHTGGANPPSCVLSTSGLGAPLVLSSSGYKPGTTYGVNFIWPNSAGEAGTVATADATGTITATAYANWTGTYTADVTEITGRVLATCSMTV